MEILHSSITRFLALPLWTRVISGLAVTAISAIALIQSKRPRKPRRKAPVKKDWKNDVVYLYQFPRSCVIPSISPCGLKLETWLRMADITYESVKCPALTQSKEGTVPFIELNGVEYCDSSFIIRDLTTIFKKESMSAHLSDEQKGVSRAIEQMTEQSIVLCAFSKFRTYLYLRYGEQTLLDKLFSKPIIGFDLPWVFVYVIKPFFFSKMYRKRVEAAGIGRHEKKEVINIGLDDIRALSKYLGTKKFFFGDTATRADATVFGTLAQIVYIPLDTPYRTLIETECTNLRRFCDTMKETFWPDWNQICGTLALNTRWK